MSTLEDFEKAPVGARAGSKGGYWAIKTYGIKEPWHVSSESGDWYETLTDRQMWEWGFYIIETGVSNKAPTTARDALDLAWELAHPVKGGQVIPKGARYLENPASGVKVFTASRDMKVFFDTVSTVRTVEPLPEPEPDWLDAPAVMAAAEDEEPHVWVNTGYTGWRDEHGNVRPWDELMDVTPLYPKGDA